MNPISELRNGERFYFGTPVRLPKFINFSVFGGDLFTKLKNFHIFYDKIMLLKKFAIISERIQLFGNPLCKRR
jgi:hypothetical protein